MTDHGTRKDRPPVEDIEALLAKADASLEAARRLLDAAVVAKRLGVSPRTLRRWIAMERVRAEQTIGGHYRIRVAEVVRLEKIYGQGGQSGHVR